VTQLEGVASRLVFGLGGTGNPVSLENRTLVVRLLDGIGYKDIMLYGFFPSTGLSWGGEYGGVPYGSRRRIRSNLSSGLRNLSRALADWAYPHSHH